MSEKYTDGLLDEKFMNLEEKIETYGEAQMKVLTSIDEQTKKTNGRTTELEKQQIRNEAKYAALDTILSELSGVTKWSQRLLWLALGAAPLATGISVWVLTQTLDARETISPVQQAAIESAIVKLIDDHGT